MRASLPSPPPTPRPPPRAQELFRERHVERVGDFDVSFVSGSAPTARSAACTCHVSATFARSDAQYVSGWNADAVDTPSGRPPTTPAPTG